jgi:CCR4-NOT transcriptional complex subunit CAF120
VEQFVQVLGSVTVPETPDHPRKTYSNVLTLNTAGSNLILFSCPSQSALVSWATALRLSAWEKSRLEEIYTAHLIRITLNEGRFSHHIIIFSPLTICFYPQAKMPAQPSSEGAWKGGCAFA